MADTDARPIPLRGRAHRITVPIYDNDGDLFSTGLTGLAAVVSKDGQSFASATNSPDEIDTSGIVTLDLTASEMDARTVAIKITATNPDAKPTVIVLHPEEPGDIVVNAIARGTAQAGGQNSITLASGESSVNDFHKFNVVWIVGGTGAGQSRVITGYDGTTKVATVHDWAVQPDNTSEYVILPLGIRGLTEAEVSQAVNDASDIDSLVAMVTRLHDDYTTARAGYLDNLDGHTPQSDDVAPLIGAPTTGSIAQDIAAIGLTVDAIQTDTEDIQSRLPASLSDGRIKADVEAISGSTAAADQLGAGAVALVTGKAQAGSETTTIITDLTETTNDHYNGRVITFTSGALAGQTAEIEDYDGTTKALTVTALTEPPSPGDTFVIS